MSDDRTRSTRTEAGRARRTVGAVVSGGIRLLLDLVAVSLWVLFLTLLFLETSWPRWVFYGALIVGVALYVTVTAAWFRGSDD
ncbi:hypothetical protein [Natrinema salaciae]|uniref:DUF8119 domain-containing protein n=1 Tax=Natrinema salaciae TaxID=1186196 RepID=A0A1H9GDZ4_9EURY|nr:hypothetical protein [Natrinema salaciae]SEQ48289.1 hypothetical protein SAMN04489841_1855 [Natrinema salaciae]